MQTHKNPSLRTGPAPFKAPIVGNTVPTKTVSSANAPIDKPPVFTRDGKKWLVVNNNIYLFYWKYILFIKHIAFIIGIS